MSTVEVSNPYEGVQEFVAQLPEFVQPLIVAALGAIPYVEGEGSAAIGVIVGMNPIVAGIAGAVGNLLSVIAVVFLGAKVRASVVARRARTAQPVAVGAPGLAQDVAVPATDTAEREPDAAEGKANRREKGRSRLRRWLVRFGVPGASILAPLALPTQLTAAFFVASGVRRRWVILWQAVAIVLWTTVTTLAATGIVRLLGW